MRGVGVMSRLLVTCVAFGLGGCLSSTGVPDRLYAIPVEMDFVRATEAQLVNYYTQSVFSDPARAKRIRNEIIAERMYAIDVNYVQYENALTHEGQEIGFGTLAAAGALGTASTLFTPVVTKSVLSGLSTATIATKGHYDSEILVAQTMRTIQKQMRASRNLVAASIAAKLDQGVAEYPLAAALSDLEEYYNAGTLTSGVIDTSTTVGIRESATRSLKQEVTQAPPSQRAAILQGVAIGSASSPITPPNGGVLNVEGTTPFERKGLTPALIRQMEAVVCPAQRTGKLTAQLRAAVLGHLGRSDQIGIDQIDAQRIVNEYRALPKEKQQKPCGG